MPVEIDKLIKKQSGVDKILTLDLISDMLIWSKPQAFRVLNEVTSLSISSGNWIKKNKIQVSGFPKNPDTRRLY